MTSDDQYADLAEQYGEAEEMPIRIFAEFPTFFDAVGAVEGAAVLDLACGTGLYPRMLAQHGARHVTGVDVSAPMIEQARARTNPEDPISYEVFDVAAMPHLGEFDLVTAVFLLHYAKTSDELAAMCENIARQLRPGGRFVGTISNSDYDPDRPMDSRYGITYDWARRIKDGDKYFCLLHLRSIMRLENYYWSRDTYTAMLEKAGLRDIEFHPWLPNKTGIQELGQEFWQPWIDNPMNVVITGQKPSEPR
ncbi:class I SAM-dependent methyltransferase [Nocardia sp. 2YAB30]|uniref:class I SAM-dependent methyltransferase n=1 Tax=Nocardia sp. 2YAB30 TaxID=3233022 RepID=UPI003F94FC1F